jgi:hypothetical protein
MAGFLFTLAGEFAEIPAQVHTFSAARRRQDARSSGIFLI